MMFTYIVYWIFISSLSHPVHCLSNAVNVRQHYVALCEVEEQIGESRDDCFGLGAATKDAVGDGSAYPTDVAVVADALKRVWGGQCLVGHAHIFGQRERTAEGRELAHEARRVGVHKAGDDQVGQGESHQLLAAGDAAGVGADHAALAFLKF